MQGQVSVLRDSTASSDSPLLHARGASETLEFATPRRRAASARGRQAGHEVRSDSCNGDLRVHGVSYRIFKRLVDIVFVLAVLPLIWPIILVCAMLVLFTSPGPMLFRQRRLGQYGRPFYIWKFRTMHIHGDMILDRYFRENPAAAEEWRLSHKLLYDPRITPLGRFLRATSLDELPQLWNVLVGDMSLIGPRPIVNAETHKYGESLRYYFLVKPGISGLWQASGRSSLAYHDRVRLDETYVTTWSPSLDLRILLRTFSVVLSRKGAC